MPHTVLLDQRGLLLYVVRMEGSHLFLSGGGSNTQTLVVTLYSLESYLIFICAKEVMFSPLDLFVSMAPFSTGQKTTNTCSHLASVCNGNGYIGHHRSYDSAEDTGLNLVL